METPNKDIMARVASWKMGKIDIRQVAAAKRIQSFYRKHLKRGKSRLGSKKFKVTNDTLALTTAFLAAHCLSSTTMHAREKHLVLPLDDAPISKVDLLAAPHPAPLSSAMQELLLLRGSPYEADVSTKDRDRLVHDAFVNMMSDPWLLCSTEERLSIHLPHHKRRVPFYSRLLGFDLKPFFSDFIFIARGGPMHSHIKQMNAGSPSWQHLHRIVDHVASLNPAHHWAASHTALKKKVEKIFWLMRSEMLMPTIRSLGWILSKIWRVLFDGVFIDKASIDVIEQLIATLGPDVGLVLTPTHKSHLDYLLVSYVCFAYGLPLPRIAAGINLNLPVVGSYLRSNGSFFIRRSYHGDTLYKEVLSSYVHQVLGDGAPMEVFVEGGRSRHGRVMKPKFGFFNMLASFLADHPTRDLLVVPISLDYDRVLEVPEYTAQLLGKAKQKESIWSLLKSIGGLFFTRCGNAYIRFGTPLPMQHHVEHFGLDALASRVAYGMQAASTITSSTIVAALLLWQRRHAQLTLDQLVAHAQWLLPLLQRRAAVVAPFDSTHELVAHALAVLQVVPTTSAAFYRVPTADASRVLELAFYRNHLLHLFLPHAALSVVVSGRIEHGASLHVSDILDDVALVWLYCTQLCPHPPVASWKTELLAWVDTLPFVHVHGGDRLAIEKYRWQSSPHVGFLNMLLWPFIDAMGLVVDALDQGGDPARSETQVLGHARRLPTEFVEAYSAETLKHALAALVDAGAVAKEGGDTHTLPLYRPVALARLRECFNRTRAVRAKVWQARGVRRQPIFVNPVVHWLQLVHGL
ncbi:Aste57867_11093 [Aphanomyces stellatus]|uniref:Aste57867_11093 protein n=1 Tax=Aphanomyces stellatus TaxID=120398 RepID=A0A485KT81_9STRA|nr:hypothetical protein As57867_011051 [Aphanomyces stellatus]VFT87960.1 Aste57867_11093 [Aphanomyces stellatus]